MGNRIQIREEWDRLTKEAARAKNAGITYGAWKARQYQKEQEEIARKEREFRAYKQRKERERQERREQRRKAREDEQKRKAAPCHIPIQPEGMDAVQAPENGLKCVQCGSSLRGHQKLYCCQRCEYIYNSEKLKRDRIERHHRKKLGTKDRFCPVCGEKILGDIRRIYCSDTCKYEMRKRRRGKNT